MSTPKPVTIGKYLDGIYPSLALLAGMQLDIFTHLNNGAQSAEEVAQALNADAQKVSMVLYALVAAELLTVDEGRFFNTDESAFYLAKGSPGYFGDIHSVLGSMWFAAFHTAETIRTGEPQVKIDYHIEDMPEEEIAAFHGMHKLSMMVVRNLTRSIDFSQHQHVADIGGGTGGIAIGLTHAYPELQATVVDLPDVTPMTAQFVEQSPTKDRIQIVSANVVENPLEGDYDAAIMRSFTQVLAADDVAAALKNSANAIVSGGKLYIVAQILDDSRTEPNITAFTNLAFLNLYDGGQAYTVSEYRGWLEAAGFSDVQHAMLTRNDSIITATRV